MTVDFTKPSYEEFCAAYLVIMHYIDTEPNSRKLFHALFDFKLAINAEMRLDEEA